MDKYTVIFLSVNTFLLIGQVTQVGCSYTGAKCSSNSDCQYWTSVVNLKGNVVFLVRVKHVDQMTTVERKNYAVLITSVLEQEKQNARKVFLVG